MGKAEKTRGDLVPFVATTAQSSFNSPKPQTLNVRYFLGVKMTVPHRSLQNRALFCKRVGTVLGLSKIIRLPRSSNAANFRCEETSWQPDYFAHPKY